MSLPKITFTKPTQLTLAPARTIPVKAHIRTVTELDLGRVKWLDDPNALTLTARFPSLPDILIMGGTSKTPYNPAWTDADAQAAFQTWLTAAMPPAASPASAPATATATAPTNAT